MKLDEYLYLYNYVRDNMEHPEWLGTFTLEEIKIDTYIEETRKN